MTEDPRVAPAALVKLGAEAGLCAHCSHAKLNQTRRGTAYLRCLRAEWDERMVRYPRLPVQVCSGLETGDLPTRSVRPGADPEASTEA